MVVYIKNYSDIPINEREILRYAGVKKASEEILDLLRSSLEIAKDKLSYRLCYCELPVSICEDHVNIGDLHISSEDLKNNLCGCDSAILFAATLGNEFDRLIAKHSSLSPAKAVMLDAIGTERIEAIANTFNDEIKNESSLRGKKTAPRFSAGYGDLPLELQRDIFALLDPAKRIGLTLNQSLLMSPSKSVTAIIGVRN